MLSGTSAFVGHVQRIRDHLVAELNRPYRLFEAQVVNVHAQSVRARQQSGILGQEMSHPAMAVAFLQLLEATQALLVAGLEAW